MDFSLRALGILDPKQLTPKFLQSAKSPNPCDLLTHTPDTNGQDLLWASELWDFLHSLATKSSSLRLSVFRTTHNLLTHGPDAKGQDLLRDFGASGIYPTLTLTTQICWSGEVQRTSVLNCRASYLDPMTLGLCAQIRRLGSVLLSLHAPPPVWG
jgi:hypothetical protein